MAIDTQTLHDTDRIEVDRSAAAELMTACTTLTVFPRQSLIGHVNHFN